MQKTEKIYPLVLTVFCYTVWKSGYTVFGIGALLVLCGVLLCFRDIGGTIPVFFLFTLAVGDNYASDALYPYAVGVAVLLFGIVFHCIRYNIFSSAPTPFGCATAVLSGAIATGGLTAVGRHPPMVCVIVALSALLWIFGRIFDSSALPKGKAVERVLFSVLCASLLATAELSTVLIKFLAENHAFATPWTVIGNKEALRGSSAVTANQYANLIARGVFVCLYYASRSKRIIPWTMLATLLTVAVFVTAARASLLMMTAVGIPYLLFCMHKSRYRKAFCITVCCLFTAVTVTFFCSPARQTVVERMLSVGLNDNGRFALWHLGVKKYLSEPWFGCGFDDGCATENGFGMPFWYHNTPIQTVASMGTVGLVALFVYLSRQNHAFFAVFPQKNIVCLYAVLTVIQLISLLDIHFYTPQTLLQMSLMTFAVLADSRTGQSPFFLSGGAPVLRMPPIK